MIIKFLSRIIDIQCFKGVLNFFKMGKKKGKTRRQYASGPDVVPEKVTAPDQGEKIVTTIEDLPTEVVSKIMCKLGKRDVVRASSTCKQWMHLPGECITSFDFNSVSPVANVCPAQKDSFINTVNQIVHCCSKLRSTTVQELPIDLFKITFCLGSNSSADIDSWVRFTVRNGVKHLSLSLTCREHRNYSKESDEEKYIFPCDVLNESPNILLESLSLRSCIFGSDLRAKCAKLNDLELSDTTITDNDMQNILSCCPNLKTLVIQYCEVPAKITIANALTYFMLQHVEGLKEFELLDAGKLIEIQYSGKFVKFTFPNTPKLADLSFLFTESEGVDYVFQKAHQDFPSLKSLTIYDVGSLLPSLANLHGRMTAFQRLTDLRFYCRSTSKFSLVTMLEILKASPLIRRFEMVPPYTLDAEYSVDFPIQAFHQSLKFVQVSGFCGTEDNLNLVKLLIQASAALEQLIIERRATARNYSYKATVHDGLWHGDEEPEAVEDQIRKFMTRGSLVFFK